MPATGFAIWAIILNVFASMLPRTPRSSPIIVFIMSSVNTLSPRSLSMIALRFALVVVSSAAQVRSSSRKSASARTTFASAASPAALISSSDLFSAFAASSAAFLASSLAFSYAFVLLSASIFLIIGVSDLRASSITVSSFPGMASTLALVSSSRLLYALWSISIFFPLSFA